MPIITSRISQGIYCHQWQGHVSIDEVLQAFELEKQLFSEDDIDKYVAILDGSNMRTMPFNISKLKQISSGYEITTLVYKAPTVAQKLGDIVSKLVRLPIEFHDDWDATLARAQKLLAEHTTATSG